MKLFLILGNQLFAPKYLYDFKDHIFYMAEDYDLCTFEKHHKHKILLFLPVVVLFCVFVFVFVFCIIVSGMCDHAVFCLLFHWRIVYYFSQQREIIFFLFSAFLYIVMIAYE